MIPLFKVFVSSDVSKFTNEVFESGYIGQGLKAKEFEYKLQKFLGAPYAAVTNSATSAIHLALHLIKTSNNIPQTYDKLNKTEILTVPLTCAATNLPILANGLKLKWVDTNPNTCNIDITDLRSKISDKTLAIIVVHWGGCPCDLNAIAQIQDECLELYGYRPPVIEDCAHAFGAIYDNKFIGNHGNFCCFSFQAIKHLTAGDGGLLVCPSKQMHDRAILLRWYGLDRTNKTNARHTQNICDWGFKFNMNDINAAIGLANFQSIELILKLHRNNGVYYNNKLTNIPGVRLFDFSTAKSTILDSSYWVYTIMVDDRENFIKHMQAKNISVDRVHDRNDKHACFYKFRSMLPGTERVCSNMICIPCGWWVSDKDREYIVTSINEGW